MVKSIEVFRAGKHRAMNGQEYSFSEADVAAIAAAYDPAVLAAPIVLGHPKTDDPAWGWAAGLSVNDKGVLVADPEKVDPAFAEGVDAGRYRYVSAKFYAPEDPANPKPGNWYLRHIGFLGAQPPAVKGLQPAFAEGSNEGEGVSFASADASTVQSLFRGLRDWIIEKDGLDVADKVIPSWYIDSVEAYTPSEGSAFAEATVAAPAGDETLAGASGSDTLTGGSGADTLTGADNPAFAERSAELDAREQSIVAREAAFAEGRRADARNEDAAFLDGLVEAGRLPPGHRDRVAAIFARLDGDQSVAFAEADADPRAELRELLNGLGQNIAFSEFAAGDGFDGQADPARLAGEITRIVSEHRARGEEISYSAAAALVGR